MVVNSPWRPTQVDFAVPRRFGLVYRDRDNTRKTPLCIHRAAWDARAVHWISDLSSTPAISRSGSLRSRCAFDDSATNRQAGAYGKRLSKSFAPRWCGWRPTLAPTKSMGRSPG